MYVHDYKPIKLTKDSRVSMFGSEGEETCPFAHIVIKSEQGPDRDDPERYWPVPTMDKWYFNKEGLLEKRNYEKGKRMEGIQNPSRWHTSRKCTFEKIDGQPVCKTVLGMAVERLKMGDPVERLAEYYNEELELYAQNSRLQQIPFHGVSTKEDLESRIRKRPYRNETLTDKLCNKQKIPAEVSQFVQRVGTPSIEREVGNPNKDTFDFIRIYIGVAQTWYMDRRLFSKKNMKYIARLALAHIRDSKRFQKYGVPINFLRLSECTLTQCSELELVFELKKLNEN